MAEIPWYTTSYLDQSAWTRHFHVSRSDVDRCDCTERSGQLYNPQLVSEINECGNCATSGLIYFKYRSQDSSSGAGPPISSLLLPRLSPSAFSTNSSQIRSAVSFIGLVILHAHRFAVFFCNFPLIILCLIPCSSCAHLNCRHIVSCRIVMSSKFTSVLGYL